MGSMVRSRVGDKDLFVRAGTFTACQMLPGGTYRIVTIYKTGSLRLEQPKIGVQPFMSVGFQK